MEPLVAFLVASFNLGNYYTSLQRFNRYCLGGQLMRRDIEMQIIIQVALSGLLVIAKIRTLEGVCAGYTCRGPPGVQVALSASLLMISQPISIFQLVLPASILRALQFDDMFQEIYRWALSRTQHLSVPSSMQLPIACSLARLFRRITSHMCPSGLLQVFTSAVLVLKPTLSFTLN